MVEQKRNEFICVNQGDTDRNALTSWRDLVHLVSSASFSHLANKKKDDSSLSLPPWRVPWEFLELRNSPSLGPKYRETRFVCIVWRIDEDSLDGGERLRRVTAGNDPIMVSRDSIRPLSFVIIANSRRSAACYRVNGRARSDPASVFSGFSASLG